MTSALISGLLGAITGVLPDIMKLFSRGMDAKTEIEMMKIQQKYDLSKMDKEYKMMEYQREMRREGIEYEAERDYNRLLIEDEREYTERYKSIMENTPKTSIRWINGFNAIIRPVLATMVMLLFMYTVLLYMWEIFELELDGPALLMAIRDFWQIPLVELAIVGPLSFLFTYRSTRKRSRL